MYNPTDMQGPLTELADANGCAMNSGDAARDAAGRALTRALEYRDELPHIANNAMWNVISYARRATELATVGR